MLGTVDMSTFMTRFLRDLKTSSEDSAMVKELRNTALLFYPGNVDVKLDK